MSKVTYKGSSLLCPLPAVLVSCGNEESANIVTVAWTGVASTDPPKIYISLRPSRHSYGIIRESGEFVVNIPKKELVSKVDFCGIYTGKKVDKFGKCAFTKESATKLSCPMIAECPISLECRVDRIIPLGTHDMFLADVVAVNIDESLIDKNGKFRLERAGLFAFAHGEYFELARRIGRFGFSAAKKKKRSK